VIEQRARSASKSDARRVLGLADNGQIIVVATTSKPTDNLSMAKALGAALSAWRGRLTLVIKTHPLLQGQTIDELLQAVSQTASQDVRCMPALPDVPLAPLIGAADLLVTNSSTTGVEAMALDVMPVFFHNPWLYDLSVLYSLESSIWLAADEQELRRAIETVLESAPEAIETRRANWEATLEALFYRLDDQAEARLLSFLQEQPVQC
jgi:CDP-glycerol glycerophosphotransferase (TagB/SpsB family)